MLSTQPTNALGLALLGTLAYLLIKGIFRAERNLHNGLRPWFISMSLFFSVVGGLYYWSTGHDIQRYYEVGREAARSFWEGNPGVLLQGLSTGTPLMEGVSGTILAILGTNWIVFPAVGALVSWLCSYALLRAFRRCLEPTAATLSAIPLFLAPSLLFWPSVVSKETWSLVAITIFFLGISGPRGHKCRSELTSVTGILLLGVMRPQLGLVLGMAVATVMAVQVVTNIDRLPLGVKTVPVFLIIIILFGAVWLGGVTSVDATFRKVEEKRVELVEATSRGGSEFEAVTIDAPSELPAGAVNVLFRPFIWEAGDMTKAMAALEAQALMLLVLMSAISYRKKRTTLSLSPHVVLSVSVVLIGIIGLSQINNFGILVRHRAMIFPFLFFILASAWPKSKYCYPRIFLRLYGAMSKGGLPVKALGGRN
jgi:hypothetical protein